MYLSMLRGGPNQRKGSKPKGQAELPRRLTHWLAGYLHSLTVRLYSLGAGLHPFDHRTIVTSAEQWSRTDALIRRVRMRYL